MHDVYFLRHDRGNHGSLHGQSHRLWKETFDHCLKNLDRVWQRCQDKDLVLNWEKCHLKDIVLGHLMSERGIKVEKAKIHGYQATTYPGECERNP